MVAIVQLVITHNATMGGALFDLGCYRATFSEASVLLIMATVTAAFAARATGGAVSAPVERTPRCFAQTGCPANRLHGAPC